MDIDLQRVIRIVEWLIFEQIVDNRRDLADKLEYTESSLSQILNGKVSLSNRFVKKLSKIDDRINESWLLTGEGQMLKGTSDTNSFSGMTDDQIEDMVAEKFRDHLLEMYEQGRAYPAAVVSEMLKDKDAKILELQQEVWRLKRELKQDVTDIPSLDPQLSIKKEPL